MSFHSYDELKQRVSEFERLTGLCYKMRRSNKFDRRYSAHERELLQYKALTFACKNYLRRENPCKSILDVRAVGDLLTVTRICMIHNHEVEEKNTIEDSYHECPSETDTTHIFSQIFTSLKFQSFEELQARLKEFQDVTGALYVIRNSNRFPENSPYRLNLKYRTLRYACYHFGKYESGASIRLNQKTSKLECTSFINISVNNGLLKIVRFNMKHTHPVTPELATLYPRRRKLQNDFCAKNPSVSLAVSLCREETSKETDRVCPKGPPNVLPLIQNNFQSFQESSMRLQTTNPNSNACFPTQFDEMPFISKRIVPKTESHAVAIGPLKESNRLWLSTAGGVHTPDL